MEAKLQIEGLEAKVEQVFQQAVNTAVEKLFAERFKNILANWKWVTAEEAAVLLNIHVNTLLDKRKKYLTELEVSHVERQYKFTLSSIEALIERGRLNKQPGLTLVRPQKKRTLNLRRNKKAS